MTNNSLKNMARAGVALAITACLAMPAWPQSAPAPAPEKNMPVKPAIDRLQGGAPSSLLYAGNSFFYFNNGINGHVNGFVQAGEPGYKLRQVMVTISGSGVDWHDMRSYFRPNALSKYSFQPDNSVVFNKFNRLFDAAMIMDCSQCPVHPELKKVFDKVTTQHIRTIRRNGAQPVLFMSWAYQDKPEMTQQLADAYTAVANRDKALVIPAGLAFARSVAQKPAVNLYAADKRHPSLAGTYLSAATTYAVLFGKSPVGSKYVAGLDAETAAHLQQVAWDTVQAYYKK
ncbi:MAG: hypothetical protein ACRCTD_00770 [Beijerinckiaceae bacterium]